VRRLRKNAARQQVPESDTRSRGRYFTDGRNLYRLSRGVPLESGPGLIDDDLVIGHVALPVVGMDLWPEDEQAWWLLRK
jgi:hypothetical protein